MITCPREGVEKTTGGEISERNEGKTDKAGVRCDISNEVSVQTTEERKLLSA